MNGFDLIYWYLMPVMVCLVITTVAVFILNLLCAIENRIIIGGTIALGVLGAVVMLYFSHGEAQTELAERNRCLAAMQQDGRPITLTPIAQDEDGRPVYLERAPGYMCGDALYDDCVLLSVRRGEVRQTVGLRGRKLRLAVDETAETVRVVPTYTRPRFPPSTDPDLRSGLAFYTETIQLLCPPQVCSELEL